MSEVQTQEVTSETERVLLAAVAETVGAAARAAARQERATAATLAAQWPVLAAAARRAARREAARGKLSAGMIDADDVAQEAAADLLARTGAAAADFSPAALALAAGAAAGRVRRAVAAALPAGTGADVLGEETATTTGDDSDARADAEAAGKPRRAKTQKIPGLHRADVYGVSDAARTAMREPFTVWAADREAAYTRAAMARPFTPRRAADAAAWEALTSAVAGAADGWPAAVAEALTLAEPLADGPVLTSRVAVWECPPARAETGDRVRGPWFPARGAGGTRRYVSDVAPVTVLRADVADVLADGYRPLTLATYRTDVARPGDVLDWRGTRWARVLPDADAATRTALARAAREWAARVRDDVRAAWNADADCARDRAAGERCQRRAARVAPFGPYWWNRPAVRPAFLLTSERPVGHVLTLAAGDASETGGAKWLRTWSGLTWRADRRYVVDPVSLVPIGDDGPLPGLTLRLTSLVTLAGTAAGAVERWAAVVRADDAGCPLPVLPETSAVGRWAARVVAADARCADALADVANVRAGRATVRSLAFLFGTPARRGRSVR